MKTVSQKILFLIGLFFITTLLIGASKLYFVSFEAPADTSFYIKERLDKRKKEEQDREEAEERRRIAEKEEKEQAEEEFVFTKTTAKKESEFPLKKVLKVPFTVQAPYQNWDVHKESCEEAAFLILLAYKKGEKLAKDSADQELRAMKKFQIEEYGKEKNLIGQDFVKFAQDYADIKLKVIKLSLESIKREINAGNPIIVPVTAKLLKNPYYPHPDYHMIVIIGYNGETIITNDPGTRRGAGFEYPFDRIKKAAADYGGIAFY